MMATTDNHIAAEFCEALNLPVKKISRLSLHFDPSDVVTVNVEVYPDSDELKDAARVFATYKFKAKR